MKYILLILMIVVFSKTNAQVPQKMSYQAIIRDANNNLLSLKNISMRISIVKGATASTVVYIETQSGKTNINGLVSLQIGAGNFVLGQFSKIDWSNGPYFVFTETDPDGGLDYRITGKSELLSVPYALYALNNSIFDTTSLHTRIIHLQSQAIENKKNIDLNIDSIKNITAEIHIIIDSVKANAAQSEINIIGIRENAKQIHINLDSIKVNAAQIENNIDSINTKISLLDLIAILSNYQRIGKILNAVTIEGSDSSDVTSKGNLRSSNDITLSGNIESIGTNSSIGTIDKPFKDLYISSNSLYIASDIVGQNIPPTVLSNLNGNLEISSGGFKLMGADAAFIAPKIISTLTGNASTATKLEIPRTINGILFDGSANITIPTGTGTVTTNANLTGVVTSVGNLTSIASGMISNSMLANAAVVNLSGTNTGDENLISIKTKLGITTLSGSNTGDQIVPTLETLRRSENELDPFFDERGILSILTLSGNILEKQTEDIDLTKSIHKLTGKNFSNYILRDGFEGQVIYLLPFGDDTNLNNITITILNGTIWTSNLLVTTDEIRPIIWTPFKTTKTLDTMVTAIFTEKKWFITGGSSVIQR